MCILLLLHSLIFFRFLFYKNMVVIYVFLLEEVMYSYCYLCILIVSLCYSCLCVVYVFLDAATLTEVFPCFFLSCKANARVNLAKTGHGPHSPKLLCCPIYCLFCVVLSRCKCVLYYCHRVTTQLQLINISYHLNQFYKNDVHIQ